MTKHTLHTLIAIIVGLILVLFVLERTDDQDVVTDERPLLPGFKAQANDVSSIRVSRAADEDSVTIRRDGDAWRVSERGDYRADVGTLRQLIIALADARIIEDKTANPDLYARLGVDDPDTGGSGTRIELGGDGFSRTVVLGEAAQRDFRYARVPDEPTSYLIDRNPDVPEEAADWLLADIVDIKATEVKRVTISHADGERIVIEKNDREAADFAVLDVPDGRELSYATVGNGIGGALSGLTLDDVRAAADATPLANTVFETWDGLVVTASVGDAGDDSWVSFVADAITVEDADAPAGDAGPAADDATAAEEEVPAADELTAGERAAELNARLSGWQYRLPDYKKNLLIRRWDDLLKAADE